MDAHRLRGSITPLTRPMLDGMCNYRFVNLLCNHKLVYFCRDSAAERASLADEPGRPRPQSWDLQFDSVGDFVAFAQVPEHG